MRHLALATTLLVLGALAATPAVAQEEAKKEYAILIVGDAGDAEMVRREDVLINEMGKLIRQQDADRRLPIFSYHFNKQRERAYCENRLNVLNEDLLFVGIVTLKNKVPLKVVYRLDRIVNPSRGAKDVLARAEELQAEDQGTPVETPEASPSPAPSGSPDLEVVPEERVKEGFRVQIGSFLQSSGAAKRKGEAEEAGLEVQVIEARGPDGDLLYKVVSPIQSGREEAEELLGSFKEAGFERAIVVP